MSATRGKNGDRWYRQDRLGGLRRFATAITILNVLGHTVLGFEPSWLHPIVGLATAYATEIVLELVDARANRRRPRFVDGENLVDFLLSAHISGLAVSMLLYASDRLAPVAFGAAVAIASKAAIRVRLNGSARHVFNPSNFGIAVTLLCFPSVGIAPPYMFTENLGTVGDWVLPGLIVTLGTLLNARFTRRLPLIAAWLSGFALQAVVRHVVFDAHLQAALLPMTGVAFLLFTFYMVTDPATTPGRPLAQVAFGLAVALAYGTLMCLHVVFGLFFALALVTAGRLAVLAIAALYEAQVRVLAPAPRGRAVPVPVPVVLSMSEQKVEV